MKDSQSYLNKATPWKAIMFYPLIFMKNNFKLFFLLYVILYHIKSLLTHSFPDYYEARTYTHINGTMQSRTSMKIHASDVEYNKMDRNRDNKIIEYLLNPQIITIPEDHYNTQNRPPVNVSGKVSLIYFI